MRRALACAVAVLVLAGCGGSQRPSTRALLQTACSEVTHYDTNAVVRMANGLPAGYAACAAPGESPVVDAMQVLHADPGPAYLVAWY